MATTRKAFAQTRIYRVRLTRIVEVEGLRLLPANVKMIKGRLLNAIADAYGRDAIEVMDDG